MTPARIPRLLSLARGLRGLVQGFLLAVFLPDLHALGWSSLTMGEALSGGLLADFLLTLAVGPLSDRISPRHLLMAGELASAVSALPFLVDPSPLALGLSIFLAGAGQRSNGSPGPWAPSEQVLLARQPVFGRPFLHFGVNMSLGLAGMGAGALLAFFWSSDPLKSLREGLAGLFFLSLLTFFLAALIPSDPVPSPRSPDPSPAPSASRPLPERRKLLLLVLLNVAGGLSIGLLDPVIAYWFLIRFHTAPGQTALFLAPAFFSAALVSFLLGRTDRLRPMTGLVLSILGISFLAGLLLPLSSSFGLAVLLYTVRLSGIKAAGGIRQALALSLVPVRNRGQAASLHLSSLNAAQIAGPLLSGLLFHSRETETPLVLSGILSGLSLVLFYLLYRSAQTKKEEGARTLEAPFDPERSS